MVRSSADGAARGQVSGDLIGREHAPGVCVSQSLPQVTHQFAIRQDLNRLSERSSARTVNTGSLTLSMLLASPDSSAGVPLLHETLAPRGTGHDHEEGYCQRCAG